MVPTLEELVADVLRQLQNFVPEGDRIHFRLNLAFGEQVRVYDSTCIGAGCACNEVSFEVPMTNSRVAVRATPEEHQSRPCVYD